MIKHPARFTTSRPAELPEFVPESLYESRRRVAYKAPRGAEATRCDSAGGSIRSICVLRVAGTSMDYKEGMSAADPHVNCNRNSSLTFTPNNLTNIIAMPSRVF